MLIKQPKIKKKPWDLDINKNASYSNIMVSPRFHMVIDRPIENDQDKIKLFVQPTNSNQYLVRRGKFHDEVVVPRVTKVLDISKFEGRKNATLQDMMRSSIDSKRNSSAEIRNSLNFASGQRNIRTASSVQMSGRLRSSS